MRCACCMNKDAMEDSNLCPECADKMDAHIEGIKRNSILKEQITTEAKQALNPPPLWKMTTKNPKEFWSKREKFDKPDECYTPKNAIYPLLPFIKSYKTIWDCAFGSGLLAEHLNKFGFNVVGIEGYDFLKEGSEKIAEFDIIITNPPYSLKDKFLERLFEIDKPFAILLPLTTLEGIKRGKMFKDKNIQIIIPNRRINFSFPDKSKKKSSCWFATAWFCYKLGLLNQLNFVELNKEEEPSQTLECTN